MRQILYLSASTIPGDGADLFRILEQSRHNNAIDGITGLLWSDGSRFLQVFEGPRDSVTSAWARICSDTRHHDIKVLRDTPITQPEFGYWSMAHRRKGERVDIYDTQMRRLLANVSPVVSQPFHAMISTGDVI